MRLLGLYSGGLFSMLDQYHWKNEGFNRGLLLKTEHETAISFYSNTKMSK